jgi:hypothetical protein
MKEMKSNIPHIAVTPHSLKIEAQEITKILKGKIIAKIWRHKPKEIGIWFTDGTRLFIDNHPEGLELSITDGTDNKK